MLGIWLLYFLFTSAAACAGSLFACLLRDVYPYIRKKFPVYSYLRVVYVPLLASLIVKILSSMAISGLLLLVVAPPSKWVYFEIVRDLFLLAPIAFASGAGISQAWSRLSKIASQSGVVNQASKPQGLRGGCYALICFSAEILTELDRSAWGYVTNGMSTKESEKIAEIVKTDQGKAFLIAAYEDRKVLVVKHHSKKKLHYGGVPSWLYYAELSGTDHQSRGEAFVDAFGFNKIAGVFEDYTGKLADYNPEALSKEQKRMPIYVMIERLVTGDRLFDARSQPKNLKRWVGNPDLARKEMRKRAGGAGGVERRCDQEVLKLLASC